jgi:NADPH2:quinone reductase
MRAAVIERYGEPPVVKEFRDPSRSDSKALIEVAAAPLNPVDLSKASGRFYATPPPVPYVPGQEGVGRILEGSRLRPGTRVYFETQGGDGSLAERTVVDESMTVEVPDGVPAALAASLGIPGLAAWIALEWRAELRKGETVLVLGASGALGMMAIQAAKLLGAGRVVAAARSQEGLARARELGADATVNLTETANLADEIKRAAEGSLQVIIDPLWGAPAVAASQAASPRARLVQLGQSAGAEATLASSVVRGKMLNILGHTNFGVDWELKAKAYRRMLGYALDGRLTMDYETLKLEDTPAAWKRQAASPHRRLVISP